MGVWDFIQDQVLGMKWLNELLGIGLSALGLDVNGRIGGSVQFFIYDVLKITVLLCVLIFAISYIQSYFPPERSKRILGRFHGIWANIISALLGTVTPFCSCSSIPLFIGFTSAGLPLGVTFSFLISSPMVDLGSLVLLMSIFGAKVAVVYVILGLVIAVIGGSMIEKLRMEKYVESFVLSAGSVDIESPDLTIRERLTYAKEQMLGTFKKVFPYLRRSLTMNEASNHTAFFRGLRQMFGVTLILLLLCGFVFPVLLTGISSMVFPAQAGGSLVYADGRAVGSKYVGQEFTKPYFMKGRPSAYHYNTYYEDAQGNRYYSDGSPFAGVSSGSNNYAPSNPALIERVKADIETFLAANPDVTREEIPTDLMTASGSGLDPHISPASAQIQIPAIAKASGLSEAALAQIVEDNTQGKLLGILGEDTVSVLGVNLDIAAAMGLISVNGN